MPIGSIPSFRDFQRPGKSEAFGVNGMAATSHPYATLAAVDALREGGNAVDAAVCAAAVQGVVEPTQTGIGGDCFALVMRKDDGYPIAVNGSGWSPKALNHSYLEEKLEGRIDPATPHSVTIPGAIAAWDNLIADYGRMSWDRVLAPAIHLAECGFCVTERVSRDWNLQIDKLSANRAAKAAFLRDGQGPRPGAIYRHPLLATTLRAISHRGGRAFYEGQIAEGMVATLNESGGIHTVADFSEFSAEYVAPISALYRGHRLWECPPNGQGAIPLLMGRMLEGYPLSQWTSLSVERFHIQAEVSRLAYAERDLLIGDPRMSCDPVKDLLSDQNICELRDSISPTRRISDVVGVTSKPHKDTVFISVVDRDRTVVALINSIFDDFGSGIACPRTGVIFHNRGSSFSFETDHPNEIAGRKRPMNTIIPAILAREDKPIMSFGVTGGHFQPAGQLQILTNIVDYGMSVQSAIDHPRMFAIGDAFQIEQTVPEETAIGLRKLGHVVTRASAPLGTCQAIWIDETRGVLCGGADGRRDGMALGY